MHSSTSMDEREGQSDDCSSRSGSGESRRSSASYTGLPPTPQFVPHSVEENVQRGADYSPTPASKYAAPGQVSVVGGADESLLVGGKASTRGLPARWLQSRWDQDAASLAKVQETSAVLGNYAGGRQYASVPSRRQRPVGLGHQGAHPPMPAPTNFRNTVQADGPSQTHRQDGPQRPLAFVAPSPPLTI